MPIRFDHLELALKSLEAALVPPPANDRERDGAIQRFEYSLELCWRTAQKVLSEQGFAPATPKDIVRELARLGMIADAQAWIDYIDSRNKTSHLYKEDVAKVVFAVIPNFFEDAKKLLETLKKAQKKP